MLGWVGLGCVGLCWVALLRGRDSQIDMETLVQLNMNMGRIDLVIGVFAQIWGGKITVFGAFIDFGYCTFLLMCANQVIKRS